jgi:hypothetical protein
MKILFTGMASSHCAPGGNVSYFSTVAKAAGEFAEVAWGTPKLSWSKKDLDEFDFVFFGFIPPTALSANKVYGALHTIGLLYDSPKLKLILDGHQIWQYKNSIESLKRDYSTIFSAFYSKRAEYPTARQSANNEYIKLASSFWEGAPWPDTYYPSLPWGSKDSISKKLSFIPQKSLIPVNLDSLLVTPEPFMATGRQNTWAADNIKSPWLNNLEHTLKYPVTPLKTSRILKDQDAVNNMRSSLGLIVPPQDRGYGTWWSYRYLQALNSSTPVVTDWLDTIKFDKSWSYLAYQLEELSEIQRINVARSQLESYVSAIKSKNQAINSFKKGILESSSERI